jgi:hypothetical protein
MGIANSGSSGFYFAQGAPVANYNSPTPTVGVHVANGCPKCLVVSATLALVSALPPAMMLGHVMPSFPHTLIGLGPFANQGCKIIFDKTSVTVFHPDGHPILKSWSNLDAPWLWQFPLTVSPPSALLPPPLVPVSVVPSCAMLAVQPLPSQGIHATNSAGDDISVVFLYGAAQAMAMAAQASNTALDL